MWEKLSLAPALSIPTQRIKILLDARSHGAVWGSLSSCLLSALTCVCTYLITWYCMKSRVGFPFTVSSYKIYAISFAVNIILSPAKVFNCFALDALLFMTYSTTAALA